MIRTVETDDDSQTLTLVASGAAPLGTGITSVTGYIREAVLNLASVDMRQGMARQARDASNRRYRCVHLCRRYWELRVCENVVGDYRPRLAHERARTALLLEDNLSASHSPRRSARDFLNAASSLFSPRLLCSYPLVRSYSSISVRPFFPRRHPLHKGIHNDKESTLSSLTHVLLGTMSPLTGQSHVSPCKGKIDAHMLPSQNPLSLR